MHLEFTLIFTTNFVGSLDIRASREVFPIEVRSPEFKKAGAVSGQITISIWLFLFLIAFAVWAILDRVLIPSTRWFLRRRINRVIDEIGTRLDIKIKPFQIIFFWPAASRIRRDSSEWSLQTARCQRKATENAVWELYLEDCRILSIKWRIGCIIC